MGDSLLVCESGGRWDWQDWESVPPSTKDSKMKWWYLNLVCYKEVVVEVAL